MTQRERLDPSGIDVVATTQDDVLLASDDAQAPVLVERSKIPGHEPSGCVERLLRRHLVVEVAEHQAGAAPADLADLADRQLDIGISLVPDPDFVTGART